ncbi:MAG: threonyl-tRNA synthetase [Pseudomonadota bacterium]|nr:threonyl-tRNA synthetase [Pseudomonadota bacterium]
MLNLRLPDGQVRLIDQPMTVIDFAKTISTSLAKSAIAAEINGKLVDMSYLLSEDAEIKIITEKDEAVLEVIRHSSAHLMAQAVKALFPTAKMAIGPVIDDGFYYDFDYERSFTPEDLQVIEKKMQELATANYAVERLTMTRREALDFFEQQNESYKVELISALPEGDTISLYRQGDFVDLCRGPHVPSTGRIKAVKIMKLAGAYWRGDVNNPMLQRIYGTAWANKEALNAYLHRLEESEKRDHRKLGRALDLFHFQDIAPGMVFWHPKGWTLYQILEQYMRNRLKDYGYQEIRTPQVVDRVLWEQSGHWQNFREEMFITETENRHYAIKPMNCPCHVQVFNQGIKSYRDLPIRFSEFGNCHRCEPSGSLHGLMRVRNMVQDDAHIFCTEEQIQSEVSHMLSLLQSVYKDFGFENMFYRLALRPEKRVGDDETWDKAEYALAQAMREHGMQWVDAPGEGAFYGPKIEFTLSDCLGRKWQCGTIQVDFSMPVRLSAEYVAEDGQKHHPVMLHRAILGSFERFIGVLIEHYAGKFPTWLAPIQVMVMPISEKHNNYVQNVVEHLQNLGFRVQFDLRNEKIGFKIREHTLQKIPFFIILGDQEYQQKEIRVRSLDGTDLGAMSIDGFAEFLQEKINQKN